jgi:hypothetical protein
MTALDTPCLRYPGRHRTYDGRPVLPSGRYVHRVLYEATHGRLGRDQVLHHECENEWCVNVLHLKPLSLAEHGALHGVTGRGDWGQALKTHCPAGHPYDEANTYVVGRKDGRVERHCRRCQNEAKRRRRREARQHKSKEEQR